jgi:hypothetical protein
LIQLVGPFVLKKQNIESGRYRKSVSVGIQVNSDVYQELLIVVFWVQKVYPDGKDIFWRI